MLPWRSEFLKSSIRLTAFPAEAPGKESFLLPFASSAFNILCLMTAHISFCLLYMASSMSVSDFPLWSFHLLVTELKWHKCVCITMHMAQGQVRYHIGDTVILEKAAVSLCLSIWRHILSIWKNGLKRWNYSVRSMFHEQISKHTLFIGFRSHWDWELFHLKIFTSIC